MNQDRDLTAVGRALSAPARVTMVNLLMDGSARPAGELARAAQVSPSTASEHLGVLVEAGLLDVRTQGRHRFHLLAGPQVAGALEALGLLAEPVPVRGLRRVREADRLAAARFCYDHLAGRLGVRLTDAWVTDGWLLGPEHGLTLTDAGADGLAGLGVRVADAVAHRRATTRVCPDWTERRAHLAGALGAEVGRRFLEAGWVERPTAGRGLRVTPAGHDLLHDRWRIDLADPVAAAG